MAGSRILRVDAVDGAFGARVPIRVLRFRGVPLDTLAPQPVAPRPRRFLSQVRPQKRSRPHVVAAVVWMGVFLGVLGSGLWWFGVTNTVPTIAGTGYQRRLPVAADRGKHDAQRASTLPAARAAVLAPHQGNRLVIPAINLQLPLVRAASLAERDIVAALTSGVVLYPNGVDPGTAGNTVVTSHSTGNPWQGPFRFAFLRVNKLQSGDAIFVDYGPQRYVYRVVHQRTINPKEISAIPSDADRSKLTLVTCSPLWRRDRRLLVEAELISKGPVPVSGDRYAGLAREQGTGL